MHTESQTRKARGRLSREDQRRLGDVLQRVYDDVLNQGVPDRFKILIDQLGPNEGVAGSDEHGGRSNREGSQNPGTVHGVHARGSDKPEDER